MINKHNTQPLISIIIPCFNNGKYVEKCLKSINKQSYQNYEVIIINDGSSDNSKSVIQNFIEGKTRYFLINQNNSGVSVARNKGLQIAKGDYICFVDADDYIEPNYLEVLYKTMVNNESDLSICSVIHENLEGEIIYLDKLKPQTLSNIETANLKKLIWGYACNKLFKKEIIQKNKLFFEKDIMFAEDELFYLNYLFKIERVSMTNDCLYHYVRQKQSATKNTTNMSVQINRFDSRKKIIDLLEKNHVNQNIINKHIIACVDTCLLVLAYKFKKQKLNKKQKTTYLKYIKQNKSIYLNDSEINWKAKFYLKLAISCLPLYVPIRRLQLRLTKRI